MTKITTNDIYNLHAVLQEVAMQPLPVAVGLPLLRCKRQVRQEWEVAEEARMQLIDRFARKEDGKPARKEDGTYDLADQASFDGAWKDLLGQPVDLPIKEPIEASALGVIRIAPVALEVLMHCGVLTDPEPTNGKAPTGRKRRK